MNPPFILIDYTNKSCILQFFDFCGEKYYNMITNKFQYVKKPGDGMVTKTSGNYRTNRAWLRDVLAGEDVVLCQASALIYLQFFVGHANGKEIDVYAKKKGQYANVNYRILDDFSELDVVSVGGLACTSFSQTINDMLEDFHNTDEQALLEALGSYYHSNNNSFKGLEIKPKNMDCFNSIENDAIDYYDN